MPKKKVEESHNYTLYVVIVVGLIFLYFFMGNGSKSRKNDEHNIMDIVSSKEYSIQPR